ncbi:MAG: hypothetical protein ACLRX2_12635 [Oscillospiraceae bacterium]
MIVAVLLQKKGSRRVREEPSAMFNIGIVGCGKIAQVRHIAEQRRPPPRPG